MTGFWGGSPSGVQGQNPGIWVGGEKSSGPPPPATRTDAGGSTHPQCRHSTLTLPSSLVSSTQGGPKPDYLKKVRNSCIR